MDQLKCVLLHLSLMWSYQLLVITDPSGHRTRFLVIHCQSNDQTSNGCPILSSWRHGRGAVLQLSLFVGTVS